LSKNLDLNIDIEHLIKTKSRHFRASSVEYSTALESLQKIDKKFIDEMFAGIKALVGFNGKYDFYAKYSWKQAEQLFPSPDKLCVFDSSIVPDDILQGDLGDCYLLAAVAAIAEYPERIKKIIPSKTINNAGIYCVQICVTGIWEQVMVDDCFPFKQDAQRPAFTYTTSQELWVMLIEKAYAKLYGGYDNINRGSVCEAICDLTGAPVADFSFDKNSAEGHWSKIMEADKKKYIMGCQSSDFLKSKTDSVDPVTGLSGKHAYSLIGAFELVTEDGRKRVLREGEKSSPQNTRLLLLRNPWGRDEWKLDWSDNSSEWTEALRSEVGYEPKAGDGLFMFPFDRFGDYFSSYQVCYYEDDFFYSAQKFESNPVDPTILRFELKKAGTYYFSLHQMNKRLFKASQQYTYSNLTMFIAREVNDKLFIYKGFRNDEVKDLFIESECEPGTYIAYILTPWRRKVNMFGFSIYGTEETEIQVVDRITFNPNFLEKAIIESVKSDKERLRSFSNEGYDKIQYRISLVSSTMGFALFTNRTVSTQISVTVDFSNIKGIELQAPYSGNKPVMVVGPGADKLLLYKFPSNIKDLQPKLTALFEEVTEDMKMKLKEKGKKIPRLDSEKKEVDISLYVMNHATGFSALFENYSSRYTLEEKVVFDIKDGKIDGSSEKSVHAVVEPFGHYLLNIVKTGPNFSVKTVSSEYKLTE
jgi:calpain-15